MWKVTMADLGRIVQAFVKNLGSRFKHFKVYSDTWVTQGHILLGMQDRTHCEEIFMLLMFQSTAFVLV